MNELTTVVTLPTDACHADVLHAMESAIRSGRDVASGQACVDAGAQQRIKVTVSVSFKPPTVSVKFEW